MVQGVLPLGILADALAVAGVYAFVLALFALAIGGTVVRMGLIQGSLSPDETASPEEMTNCPDCGARTPIDRSTCEYCDTPLDDGDRERRPRSDEATAENVRDR